MNPQQLNQNMTQNLQAILKCLRDTANSVEKTLWMMAADDVTNEQLKFDDATPATKTARKSPAPTDRRIYPNGNRAYSEREDWMLIGMYHAGMTRQEMAQRLARPPKGIDLRLLKLRKQGSLD